MLDPSLFVLFFVAISCIIYGSYKSYSFYHNVTSKHIEAAEAVNSLKLSNVIIFPIIGCAVLLGLFFFFDKVFYLLLILVTIVSFAALFFVFVPAVDAIFGRAGWDDKTLRIPRLPPIPVNMICISIFCISIIVLWIVTGYWLVVDCIAWCIGVTQLSLLRLPNLKLSMVLLLIFLVYDVFWVFLSPYFFGGDSVMVEVATRMPTSAIPMILTMPSIIGDTSSLMGLGDIVLPGLYICFLYGFDKTLLRVASTPTTNGDDRTTTATTMPKVSYFTISLIGYTVGFAMTMVSAFVMNKGQPALLFLVPCILAPTCIASYFQGHFMQMWRGGLETTSQRSVEDRPLLSLATSEGKDDGELHDAVDDGPVVIDVVSADAIKYAVNNGENNV